MKTFKITENMNMAKAVLGVLIATFAFAAAASAQSAFEGKFVLPHEVHWNRAVLPAGEYSIQMDSTSSYAILYLASTHRAFVTAVPIVAKAEKGAARVNVTNLGNVSRVRSINLPETGQSLIFDPLTKNEKEMLAKTGQTDVPLITARK